MIIDILRWCDDIRDSGTRLMLPVASAINVAAAFRCGKGVAARGDFQHRLGFAMRLGITAVPVAVGGGRTALRRRSSIDFEVARLSLLCALRQVALVSVADHIALKA